MRKILSILLILGFLLAPGQALAKAKKKTAPEPPKRTQRQERQLRKNITVDPYFGKKIAGGFYVSGEASYIEYIGGYYYLFVTYGGLAAGGNPSDYNNGGYQMRVFRSKNPDGPYLDAKNDPAVFSQYLLNFGPKENDNNRGVNIFGAYSNWGYQTVGNYGERSQGHNSIIAAEDGRTYLVYQSFVLTRLLPQSALQHRLVSQHTGVAFVPHLHRYVWYCFLQLLYKGFHSRQIVTVSPVGLLR